MQKKVFIYELIKVIFCDRRLQDHNIGGFVPCFTNMLVNKGRVIKFDVLSKSITFLVVSTTQNISRWFSIARGIGAATQKLIENIRVQEEWTALLLT